MSALVLLVALAIPVVAGVVVLVVVLVVVRSQPRPAPVAPGGAPMDGAWFAEIGGGPGSTYGAFTIADGHLSFVPDGATEPAWVVACRDLGVRRQGVGPFAITSVLLVGPMGQVACNVSREHINRFMTNSAKTFREAGYATQFVAAVQAQGAHPLAV